MKDRLAKFCQQHNEGISKTLDLYRTICNTLWAIYLFISIVETLYLSLTKFFLPVSQSAAQELITIFLGLWLLGSVLLIFFISSKDESFDESFIEILKKSVIAAYFITIIVLNILLCSYFLSKWLYICIALVIMSLIKNIADKLLRYSTKFREK